MKNIVLIVIILVVIAVLVQFVVKSPKSDQLPLENPSAEIVPGSTGETPVNPDQTSISPNIDATAPQTANMPPTPNTEPSVEMITTASGLQYGVVVPGTGKEVKSGDIVTVHYIGTLTDGREFDSSVGRGQPAQFPIGVGQLIKGWDEGIPGMKVGEKRVLVVPGNLAYGSNPPPGSIIGPNATLVFQVEVLDTKSQ